MLRLTLIAGVVPLLLAACGEPPQPLPTSPPYSELPSSAPVGVPPAGGLPSGMPAGTGLPLPTPTNLVPLPGTGGLPGFPANPGLPTYAPATTVPTNRAATRSPGPTPSHAPKCAGPPTGAQILALISGTPGVPHKTLKVADGPHCAADWSFTTVEVAGKSADQQDPLFVVALGSGTDLALVTAGSDVCNDPVQKQAPPGIRVLACGF